MDEFARILAGVTSPADFFSDENAGRILAASYRVACSPMVAMTACASSMLAGGIGIPAYL
jgi:hypothetical protein